MTYEAEAAVLGSVLLEGSVFKNLTVTVDQFERMAHKLIFRAMKQVEDLGQTIDLVTVTAKLGHTISNVGGTTYLVQLAESVPSIESVSHYERLMFESYRNRKTREIADRYAQAPSDEKLEKLIKYLEVCREIGTGKVDAGHVTYLDDLMKMVFTGEGAAAGLPTSFTELDNLTGGLQPGELIIIAARPSVGKTAFALNLAAEHCRNKGMSSFFSFEMGQKQLLMRMISAEGNIHNQKWRSMAFNEDDYGAVTFAVGEISAWKLAIYEKQRTISDIRAYLRKSLQDYPEEKHLAIIDYLQLITPITKNLRRDLEVGEMTRELKLLAIELNIPIVLLSQLSRGVEQRHDKRPFMSDLRESGNIEQDADVIAFLYRDDYYEKESDKKNIVEVILAKQRNGPTGTVELTFQKEYGRFQNVVKEAWRKKNENAQSV